MFGKIKSLLSAIPELFLKIELIQLVWVTAYNFGKSISQAFFDGFNESKFETISDYISDQIIYFWERLWNNINGLGWNTDY